MDAKNLYDFGFVLPHWFYWSWLVVSPIILIIWSYYLENKKKQRGEPVVTEEEGPNGPEPSNAMTRVIDWICEHAGQVVGFWTISAVCFYAF